MISPEPQTFLCLDVVFVIFIVVVVVVVVVVILYSQACDLSNCVVLGWILCPGKLQLWRIWFVRRFSCQ